jgi:hypothetical protein
MTAILVSDLITLTANRLRFLSQQLNDANFRGDNLAVVAIEKQIEDTQETLDKLRSVG